VCLSKVALKFLEYEFYCNFILKKGKKMEQAIQRDVKVVIEETSSAYKVFSDYECMNADFADFAVMALGQFQDALRKQDLTRADLEKVLRSGMTRHRGRAAETDWTTFMASYVTTASNEDLI
jgi:hypothetical protein